MRTKHSLLLIILAILLTGVTYFMPPLFPENTGEVEHGFPLPWAFHIDLPTTGIPFLDQLLGYGETATLHFKWQYFLVDVGIFTVALFPLYALVRKPEEHKT